MASDTRHNTYSEHLKQQLTRRPTYDRVRNYLPFNIDRYEELKFFKISSSSNEITVQDLFTILPDSKIGTGWLSGDVVNLYLKRLRNKHRSILPVDCLLATQVSKSQAVHCTFEQVLRTRYGSKEFRESTHLWPVNVGSHWILISGHWPTRQFAVHDSQNQGIKYKSQADNIIQYYAQNINTFLVAEATIIYRDLAVEDNQGRQCGPYILMRSTMMAAEFPIMPYDDFRARLATELLTQQILDADAHPNTADIRALRSRLKDIDDSLKEKLWPNAVPLSQRDCHHLLEIVADMRDTFLEDYPQAAHFFSQCEKFSKKGLVLIEKTNHSGKDLFKYFMPEDNKFALPSPRRPKEIHASTSSCAEEFASEPTVEKAMIVDYTPPPPQAEISREALVERHFARVKESLSEKDWNDADFQQWLAHEKEIQKKAKPLSLTVQPEIDLKPLLREAFDKMVQLNIIPASTPPGTKVKRKAKQELSYETYEEGMSGDERAPLTHGAPFKPDDRVQCSLCGTVCQGIYNGTSHVLSHSLDKCFQRPDVFNRFHPRINIRKLTTPNMVSAIYLQAAPDKEPPNRYRRNEWTAEEVAPLSAKHRSKSQKKIPPKAATPVKNKVDKLFDQIVSSAEESDVEEGELEEGEIGDESKTPEENSPVSEKQNRRSKRGKISPSSSDISHTSEPRVTRKQKATVFNTKRTYLRPKKAKTDEKSPKTKEGE